jgi:Ca2+-transporting ATPase
VLFSDEISYIDLLTNKAFLFSGGGSIIGQLLVIYAPPLQKIFQTEPISLTDLLSIVALTSSVWIVSEFKKFFENGMKIYSKDNRKKAANKNDFEI